VRRAALFRTLLGATRIAISHTENVFWTHPSWRYVFRFGIVLFFVIFAMRVTDVVLIAIGQTGSVFLATNVLQVVLTVLFFVFLTLVLIRKVILDRSEPPAD
jgi:hypothetical protein